MAAQAICQMLNIFTQPHKTSRSGIRDQIGAYNVDLHNCLHYSRFKKQLLENITDDKYCAPLESKDLDVFEEISTSSKHPFYFVSVQIDTSQATCKNNITKIVRSCASFFNTDHHFTKKRKLRNAFLICRENQEMEDSLLIHCLQKRFELVHGKVKVFKSNYL